MEEEKESKKRKKKYDADDFVEFELADKLIIVGIVVIAALSVLATIWWVTTKHNKELEEKINSFTKINQNETYRYTYEDDLITIYEGIEKVADYQCNDKCTINDIADDKFNIGHDNYISILDGKTYMIFNISTDSVYYILDTYPKVTESKEYGLIVKNGKYGLMDSNAGIVLDLNYDEINSVGNYFLAIQENKLQIFDKEIKELLNTPISVSEGTVLNAIYRGDSIYIYLTDINHITTNYTYNTISKTLN